METKETIQEEQYHFPYHHLSHESGGGFYLFRHLFWGLDHYTYINYVINEVLRHKFKSLADVGCGEGRILFELSSHMPETSLQGYDISESALHFARGFSKIPLFVNHDITLQKIEAPVEAIISCEVIEHIKPDEVDAYCKHIADSLVDGGIFFITTPTTNLPVNSKHYQHFTQESLKKYLEPYFIVEDITFLNVYNTWSKFLNKIIANRFYLSNIPFLNSWVLKMYRQKFLIGETSCLMSARSLPLWQCPL